MGIKGLHTFLRNNFPEIYRKVPLSHYAEQKVAIDVMGYLYKFMIINPQKWFDSMVYLVCALRKWRIHPVFIFDGEAPPEKMKERQRRHQAKGKIADRHRELSQALEEYRTTGTVLAILEKEMKNHSIPSLLHPGSVNIDERAIEKRLTEIDAQMVSITPADLTLLHQLFEVMEVPFFQASGEAETLCAQLALSGQVEAVISTDTDVLAYGTPHFIHHFDTFREECSFLELEKVLSAMEFTLEQFRDFCIMCGCDYNQNIHRIGPTTAYRLLQRHGSLEEVLIALDNGSRDLSVLNHLRCRQLFTPPETSLEVPPSTYPDLATVKRFLLVRNSRVRGKTLELSLTPPELEFLSDSEDEGQEEGGLTHQPVTVQEEREESEEEEVVDLVQQLSVKD